MNIFLKLRDSLFSKSFKTFAYQNLWIFIATICVTISVTSSQRLPLGIPLPPSISNLLTPGTTPPSEYTYRQSRVLNAEQGFAVTWDSNRNLSSITFNVSAPLPRNGSGVVFGVSRRGQVQGSDVVLIRLDGNGQPSILDMHGSGNNTISVDTTQSWTLLRNGSRIQNGTMRISLSRPYDTCDEQDIIINNNLLHLIYGKVAVNGTNSTRNVRFAPSGSTREYLLDPMVNRPGNESEIQEFRIERVFRIPPRRTSYWCTIHKGPSLLRKHHIIGFEPYFGDERARQHVHHQVVYRCLAPPMVDPGQIFDRYVDDEGEECYLEERHRLPTHFCTEMVHTFGIGGRGFTFPESVGLVLGETENEYFMLETHYDNPEGRSDLVVENGVNFQYTSRVRPIDGGIIFVGTGVLGLHLVPPQSTNFQQIGQCSEDCTAQLVPLTGMEIIGAMLHGHPTVHRMKLRHFRDNKEFPYVISDDNYEFDFQQVRHTVDSPLILPGDRLVVECTMNTTSRNYTTVSGFSTNDEMCVTFIIVNKRLPYLYCLSEYPTERTMERFGVQNMTWDRELQERVVNEATDPSHVGQTLTSVIDGSYEWTPERRRELEREQNNGTHNAACPPVRRMVNQAYVAYFVEEITGGLIDRRESIENERPSTRTVWTPQGPDAEISPRLRTTSFVTETEILRYIPPEPCTEIIPRGG